MRDHNTETSNIKKQKDKFMDKPEFFSKKDVSDDDMSGLVTWTRRHAFFIKCVSLTLSLIFLHQQLGWSQEGKPVWAYAKPMEINQPQDLQKSEFEIPYDIADTQSVKKNGGDEVIVHIQDAHASLSAQYSIAKLLDSLVTNYDLQFIALEGSAGYIDTSLLKTFPDKKIREDTASFLMREGRMSAGEFFTITSDREDIQLYGIEDDEIYRENIESFRAVAKERAKQTGDLSSLLEQLNALGEKIFSKDLKVLNDNSVLHREGSLSFSDHWKSISDFTKKYNIDISGYTEITKLLESMELEEGIDFGKANTERRSLIDELSRKVDKPELESLVLKSLAFKQNKVSQGDFHRYLVGLAESKGIPADGYENLINFTRYVTIYESVEIFKLYRGMEGLEDSIREKLYRSDDERELCKMTKMARLLKQLYAIELNNREFAYVENNHKDFTAERYSRSIREKCGKYNVAITGEYDLSGIVSGIVGAMKFYRDAEARNNAMIANTIANMRKEGKHVAALITGGYHTEGLTSLMEQKGLSYLVVVPKFENEKERPYVAILTNKKKPYEKILETGRYQLAVAAYFDEYEGDLNKIKPAVFYALGAQAIEGGDVESTKLLWEQAYRTAYAGIPAEAMGFEPVSPDEFKAFLDSISVLRYKKKAIMTDGNVFVTLAGKDLLTFDPASKSERDAFLSIQASKALKEEAEDTEKFAAALTALKQEVAEIKDLKDELKVITTQLGSSIAREAAKEELEGLAEKLAPEGERAALVVEALDGAELNTENVREVLRNLGREQRVRLSQNWQKDKGLAAEVDSFIVAVQEQQKLDGINLLLGTIGHIVNNRFVAFAFFDMIFNYARDDSEKEAKYRGTIKRSISYILEFNQTLDGIVREGRIKRTEFSTIDLETSLEEGKVIAGASHELLKHIWDKEHALMERVLDVVEAMSKLAIDEIEGFCGHLASCYDTYTEELEVLRGDRESSAEQKIEKFDAIVAKFYEDSQIEGESAQEILAKAEKVEEAKEPEEPKEPGKGVTIETRWLGRILSKVVKLPKALYENVIVPVIEVAYPMLGLTVLSAVQGKGISGITGLNLASWPVLITLAVVGIVFIARHPKALSTLATLIPGRGPPEDMKKKLTIPAVISGLRIVFAFAAGILAPHTPVNPLFIFAVLDISSHMILNTLAPRLGLEKGKAKIVEIPVAIEERDEEAALEVIETKPDGSYLASKEFYPNTNQPGLVESYTRKGKLLITYIYDIKGDLVGEIDVDGTVYNYTRTELDFLKATPYEVYRPGQISALRKLKNGILAELGTGRGKTVPLAGAALARWQEMEQRSVIFTHSDPLTEQAMNGDEKAPGMGVVLSNCGAATGFILPDSKGGEIGYIFENGDKREASIDEVYDKCAIVYAKWERVVHRHMRETVGTLPKALKNFERYGLFDEADLILIFSSATPCIISGKKMDDWKGRLQVRTAIKRSAYIQDIFNNSDLYYTRDEAKEVFLTTRGQGMVNKALRAMASKRPKLAEVLEAHGNTFVIDALKAHLFYKEDVQYFARRDKSGRIIGIYVRDEATGAQKVGMSFGEGIQQAVEINAGVVAKYVTPETYTLMSETIVQFLNSDLIIDFAGASGTLAKDRMASMYTGKTVEAVAGLPPTLKKEGHRGFATEERKRRAALASAVKRFRAGQPVFIKVQSEVETVALKNFFEANLPKDVKDGIIMNIADGKKPEAFESAIKQAGYANVWTIATNVAHRGVNINVQGCRLDEDGSEGEMVPDDESGLAPGLHVMSYYMDEDEDFEIQTMGRGDRGINAGSWEGLFCFDELLFQNYPALLAHHKILLEQAVRGNDKEAIEELIHQIRSLVVSAKNRNDERRREYEDEVFAYQQKFLRLFAITRLAKGVPAGPRGLVSIRQLMPFIMVLRSIGVYNAIKTNLPKVKEFLKNAGMYGKEVEKLKLSPDEDLAYVINCLRLIVKTKIEKELLKFQTEQQATRKRLSYLASLARLGVRGAFIQFDQELANAIRLSRNFRAKEQDVNKLVQSVIAQSLAGAVSQVKAVESPAKAKREALFSKLKIIGAIVLVVGISALTVIYGLGPITSNAFQPAMGFLKAQSVLAGIIGAGLLIPTVYLHQMYSKKIGQLDRSTTNFMRFTAGIGKGSFLKGAAKWAGMMALHLLAGPGMYVGAGMLLTSIVFPVITLAAIPIPVIPIALSSIYLAFLARLVLIRIFQSQFHKVEDVRPTPFRRGVQAFARTLVVAIGALFTIQISGGSPLVTGISLLALLGTTLLSVAASIKEDRKEGYAKVAKPVYLGILAGVVAIVGIIAVATSAAPLIVPMIKIAVAGLGVGIITMQIIHARTQAKDAAADGQSYWRTFVESFIPNSRNLIMRGVAIWAIFVLFKSGIISLAILVAGGVAITLLLHRYGVNMEKIIGRPVSEEFSQAMGGMIMLSAGASPMVAFPQAIDKLDEQLDGIKEERMQEVMKQYMPSGADNPELTRVFQELMLPALEDVQLPAEKAIEEYEERRGFKELGRNIESVFSAIMDGEGIPAVQPEADEAAGMAVTEVPVEPSAVIPEMPELAVELPVDTQVVSIDQIDTTPVVAQISVTKVPQPDTGMTVPEISISKEAFVMSPAGEVTAPTEDELFNEMMGFSNISSFLMGSQIAGDEDKFRDFVEHWMFKDNGIWYVRHRGDPNAPALTLPEYNEALGKVMVKPNISQAILAAETQIQKAALYNNIGFTAARMYKVGNTWYVRATDDPSASALTLDEFDEAFGVLSSQSNIKAALDAAVTGIAARALYNGINFVAGRMYKEGNAWYVRAVDDPNAPALTIEQFNEAFGVLITQNNIILALANATTDAAVTALYNGVYFAASRMYKQGNNWYVRVTDNPNALALTIEQFDEAFGKLTSQANIKAALDAAVSDAAVAAVYNGVYFAAGRMYKKDNKWYVRATDNPNVPALTIEDFDTAFGLLIAQPNIGNALANATTEAAVDSVYNGVYFTAGRMYKAGNTWYVRATDNPNAPALTIEDFDEAFGSLMLLPNIGNALANATSGPAVKALYNGVYFAAGRMYKGADNKWYVRAMDVPGATALTIEDFDTAFGLLMSQQNISAALANATTAAAVTALYNGVYFAASRMYKQGNTWYVRAADDPNAPALTLEDFDTAFGLLMSQQNISAALANAVTEAEVIALYNGIYFTAARMYKEGNNWYVRTITDPSVPALTLEEFDTAFGLLMSQPNISAALANATAETAPALYNGVYFAAGRMYKSGNTWYVRAADDPNAAPLTIADFDTAFGLLMSQQNISAALVDAITAAEVTALYNGVYFTAGMMFKEGNNWYVRAAKDPNAPALTLQQFDEAFGELVSQTNIKAALDAAITDAAVTALYNGVYFVASRMYKQGNTWYVRAADDPNAPALTVEQFDEAFGELVNQTNIKAALDAALTDAAVTALYNGVFFAAARMYKEGDTWYVRAVDDPNAPALTLDQFDEAFGILMGLTNIKAALESATTAAEVNAVYNLVYFVATRMFKPGDTWYVRAMEDPDASPLTPEEFDEAFGILMSQTNIKTALEEAGTEAELTAVYNGVFFAAARMYKGTDGKWYVRAVDDPDAPALTVEDFDEAFGELVNAPNIKAALDAADTDAKVTALYNSIYFVAARMFKGTDGKWYVCLLYTSPSPRDGLLSRMPSSA